MRPPFDDVGDSSWWAVHGASRSSAPMSFELERDDTFADASPRDEAVDGAPADERSVEIPEDLALREQIAASERETVKDLALVRAAAALMNEPQPTA
ncbi:MAG: hypothetical protein KF850_01320 [Labilithrix sp.]|nr:hypothetical protein [Labilithrix sp.]